LNLFEAEGIGDDGEPPAKTKNARLIVRMIDGETLVYDRALDAATCLDAPKVWRQCDGETSVAGIAVALGEDKHAAAIVAPTATHASCVRDGWLLSLR
jgi:hypothetical protein